MKKRISIIFTLISLATFSQTFNYASKFGSPVNERTYAVSHDAAGSSISGGQFSGVIDLDPSAAIANFTASGSDAFICKLNQTGNYIWGFTLSGSGSESVNGISVDNSGNIYLTGAFGSTTDFDPGVGVVNLISSGTQDVFVAKYNSSGVFQWAFRIGNSNTDVGYRIRIDQNGDVLVAGDFRNIVDFDPGAGIANLAGSNSSDAFLAKYTSNGNYVWAISLYNLSSQSNALGLTIDSNNNVFLSGQFFGTKDFDPSPSTFNLTSNGNSDAYLAKYNSAGAFQWALNVGSIASDFATCVVTDNLGNVFLSGTFQGTVDFDPTATVYNVTSYGLYDAFLAKYNSSGGLVFANTIGGTNTDVSKDIGIDASDNPYITGFFYGTADFDPSPATATISSLGQNEIFVAKYNSAGQYQYAFSIGNTSLDEGTSISVSLGGDFYIGGSFENTVDFNPSVGINNLTSSGNLDAFIAKYSDCLTPPPPPGPISGSLSICGGVFPVSYSISAVPGSTSYSWTLPNGWAGTSFTNVITVTVGLSGNVSVSSVNGCGTSPAQTLSIVVNPSPTVTAVSNSSLLCVGQSATLTAGGANNYTWSPGGAGANIAISPTVTTTYTVLGVNANGCQNTTSFTQNVSTCTGINTVAEALDAGVEVYPNPTNGFITMVCPSIEGVAQSAGGGKIEIYNSIGQLLIKEKIIASNQVFNLNTLANGIYFVKVQSGDEFVIKKIIKQ